MVHNRNSLYQGLLHSSIPTVPTQNQVSQFQEHLSFLNASFQHRAPVQNMSLMQYISLQQPENLSPTSETRESSASLNSSSSSPVFYQFQ